MPAETVQSRGTSIQLVANTDHSAPEVPVLSMFLAPRIKGLMAKILSSYYAALTRQNKGRCQKMHTTDTDQNCRRARDYQQGENMEKSLQIDQYAHGTQQPSTAQRR